ncbi:LysR substrate-binding domain-containing protein [Streptomyces sp. NBC_01361]|nr:LysR substrate-binding domain-containing protein [Streptomyces sp. NBC_01361]
MPATTRADRPSPSTTAPSATETTGRRQPTVAALVGPSSEPRNHPLTERRAIDFAELAGEPWVDTEGVAGPCHEIVRDACAAAGFSPDFSVASQDYATPQGFVAAGMGIGLMPLMGLRNRRPDVVLRKVRKPEG